MSKIILLAPGEHIERLGLKLKSQLDKPYEFDVILAHMDKAVSIALNFKNNDIDVIIARGNTASILKKSSITIPIVEIPIEDTQIISAIKKAQELCNIKNPKIGYIGAESIINKIKSFLTIINPKVIFYSANTVTDIEQNVKKATEHGIDIIIGGDLSCSIADKFGLKSVILQSSFESIKDTYKLAKELQSAVNAEKRKVKEKNTIFNSVSEAIISINDKSQISMINKNAELLFNVKEKEILGLYIRCIFKTTEEMLIAKVMSEGEKVTGKTLKVNDKIYSLSLVPVLLDSKPTGVIITFQEVNELQKTETTIRKKLYKNSNTAQYTFKDINGKSEQLCETITIAKSFASVQSNVLIIGQTGTGKELFAQSIHNASSRRDGPFVAVNCGAIPNSLVESELFGYVDGAFTGAKKGGKMGLFELAHKGTIFLDEVSEMDMIGQVILLRVLQERQIRRVGGNSPIPINVRVIAACNTNLYEMVMNNKFRKDLYYRLSVLVLQIPPLNNRIGDIPYLSNYFIKQYCNHFNKKITLSLAAYTVLDSFNWDGNIRQLKNFCERIVAISNNNSIIDDRFIERQLQSSYDFNNLSNRKITKDLNRVTPIDKQHASNSTDTIIIKNRVISISYILELLERYQGNKTLVANELGISRTTLWKHLKYIDKATC